MLNIKSFVFNDFAVNSFIIYDDTKDCIIVDPGCVSEKEQLTISSFIKENNLKPTKLINTHCHVDHVAGNKYIVDTYKIPIYAHKEDSENLANAQRAGELYGMIIDTPPAVQNFLVQDDTIDVGNSTLKIFHLPGHSKGSIALYSKDAKFIVVGDVIFNGSVGRTDLNGGSLDELMNSIKNKLFKLDDEVTIYSGHGPETTIGNEVRSNPFLLDNVL